MYDYSHDPTSGAYDVPSEPYDPYDIYERASIYDEIQPESPTVTSFTKCDPDVTVPPPPEINLSNVTKLRSEEISPNVNELCSGSLEDVI